MTSLILVGRSNRVGIARLNRPKSLNALSSALIDELLDALRSFDKDPEISAIVLTGNETVFAAGADIKELMEVSFIKAYQTNFLQVLEDGIASIRKPIIAAVNGYVLGGGCELALMCDIIYAGEGAVFGQPEVKIGTIPGIGGTQRLIRAIGKAKAMDMILTGEVMNAVDAEKAGLVARVVPDADVLNTAIATAEKIASYSIPVIMMAKEAVNAAHDTTLSQGLRLERRLYHSSFGLMDSKEGMRAFVEKREPVFQNQ